MRKIEGPNALLAPIQYGGAVMLTVIFQIICLFWLLASFRPEISPEIIRACNDYGWLVWTIFIPTYSMQYVCMALAAFIVFAAYVGGALAFTALYVARGYKNGLQRPSAVIDRKRSAPPPPLGAAR